MQISLDPSEYPFLNSESFIECSTPIESFTMTELTDQITGNPGAGWRMEITDQTREDVIKAIIRNKTLSPRMKSRLTDGLSK